MYICCASLCLVNDFIETKTITTFIDTEFQTCFLCLVMLNTHLLRHQTVVHRASVPAMAAIDTIGPKRSRTFIGRRTALVKPSWYA